MPITQEAGQQLGKDLLAAFKAGFVGNNHDETCGAMMAQEVSWDWADGFKGTGPPEKIFEQLKATWGAMVCSFTPAAAQVIVDTDNGKISIFTSLVICIDGGFPDQKHVVRISLPSLLPLLSTTTMVIIVILTSLRSLFIHLSLFLS